MKAFEKSKTGLELKCYILYLGKKWRREGLPSDDYDEEFEDNKRLKLSKIFESPGRKFVYTLQPLPYQIQTLQKSVR